MLGLKELLGGKLKFALIATAITLVVSLIMVTTAMSEGLLTGMSGAKSSLDADALVFQKDTYPTFERSILSAADMDVIIDTEGVADAYGVGHTYASVGSVADPFDVRVFGLGDRFDQLPIIEGTGDVGPGEAVLDETARLEEDRGHDPPHTGGRGVGGGGVHRGAPVRDGPHGVGRPRHLAGPPRGFRARQGGR